jgi:two-component system OmpR family sensor kinase/two-component system sensor histidine kinase BaeS
MNRWTNRLWIRMSFAFSGIVLLSVLLIVGLALLVGQIDAQQNADVRQMFRTSEGLIDRLRAYYTEHNGWEGVENVLSGAESVMFLGPRNHVYFSLMDEDKRVLYDVANPDAIGRILSTTTDAIPITVDGDIKGYLDFHKVLFPPPMRRDFGPLANFGLLVALVGGVLGIASGVIMSRGLSAPLNRLAVAAQAIGARKRHERVTARGSVEIVALADAFNEMADALEKAETLRRNMVADVAHELRTPLSVLQGNLRAMLDGVYKIDKEEIARLYDQTRVLNRLVNDLHELTLAEAQQLPLNMQPTDLTTVIQTVTEMFAPMAEAEGVVLKVEVSEDLPLVRADSVRLGQVLNNLLVNAVRHTSKGGEIGLCATASEKQITVTVNDTGEGIQAEHLPHIFERFYRADKARARSTGGTGLGLAIVRALIEAHHGTITANSAGIPGQGTAFIICLPILAGEHLPQVKGPSGALGVAS